MDPGQWTQVYCFAADGSHPNDTRSARPPRDSPPPCDRKRASPLPLIWAKCGHSSQRGMTPEAPRTVAGAGRFGFHPDVIRLSHDFEHESRTWWENGGTELWEGITEGFEDSSVVVDDDLAASWLASASSVEGWNDGPDYAPHPITSRPLEDDEEA